MGLRDLAIVLVRLYGLSLLFHCLQAGQQAYFYKTIAGPPEPILKTYFLISTASATLYAVVGVCSVVFAKTIADWVTPKTSDGPPMVVSTADLALVSFSLVGIYFFVDGISWLVHDGVAWCVTPKLFGTSADFNARTTAGFAMYVIKIVAGLFLLFGSRGVVRVIRWTREEGGRKSQVEAEEVRQPAIGLTRVPKCPNCGADYNLEDYRRDAAEWLCSRCGTALPKE